MMLTMLMGMISMTVFMMIMVVVIAMMMKISIRFLDNSPPDKNKAQLLPTRTTIPRTTPH